MRIIFLNYGLYASNSGGHIANFAAELAKLGHSVAICAEGDPDAAREVCGELVEYFSHESVDFEPTSLMGGFSPQDVIIHAWTPRDKVVFLTETLMSQGAGHYVVHLEDNEELLTAANLGLKQTELVAATENLGRYNFPLSLSHPTRYKDFIRGSSGATVIVEPLSEFVHPDVPVHILEPGVSVDYFGAELSPEQRSSVRQRYGAAEDDIVCVYHGNMHRANEREIFSLYTANLILQRRGIKFRLIRAGKNFTDGLDLSFDYLRSNVMEVGYLSSEELLRLLQIADLFVQPGASNAFNDYRFPSKIPEFLARGRPVLLPATNIGLRLRDGVDAILLRRGDGEEIADKIETLVSDQARCKDLGAHARRFAEEQLNWSTNAKSLVHFYAQCMQKPNGGILNGQSKKV
ncbi:glycosyltransferase family 4 protein [Phreatobacter oligotrophus]|uniref:Glycosyltransferase involved in cell wall biosynthesis n=1 Tax=Phreatobacter oligotrophus TaxID=1122261 RepID=A0A2T4YP35_9HYPH|nr:glycosyltransferase family 4 protein [Phreatobacter oligotrophus]PTM45280.1 glycosyltransferase involved in cell wall biosynthesis [Phreatobacter oligotrophus]